MSSHFDDFNTRNKILTAKISNKDIDIMNFLRRFFKYYRRHFDLATKYKVKVKIRLLQGFSKLEFYGALVNKFRKQFPYHFKKIIIRYKKNGYI